jgi:hypothetical protein
MGGSGRGWEEGGSGGGGGEERSIVCKSAAKTGVSKDQMLSLHPQTKSLVNTACRFLPLVLYV